MAQDAPPTGPSSEASTPRAGDQPDRNTTDAPTGRGGVPEPGAKSDGDSDGKEPGQPPRGFRHNPAGFLLLLVLIVPYSVMVSHIAKRKGRNVVLWVIISLIPGPSVAVLWLVSLTDRDVMERLARLEETST